MKSIPRAIGFVAVVVVMFVGVFWYENRKVGDVKPILVDYKSANDGFSLQYPEGFIVDESYKYQQLGPGKDIEGVKFTIPETISSGTNLAEDSYISVEKNSREQTCSAALFFDPGMLEQAPKIIKDGKTTYSVASGAGAGLGNRYEETVYAILNGGSCIAVRYFIHYGVMENYPIGQVKEFDKQTLLNQFDSIRRTLVTVSSAETEKTGSTIKGRVTLSPVCPVERMPPDPACAPKPYQTSIEVFSADGTELVKTLQSQSDGSFTFTVPYGDYDIEAGGGKVYPRCQPVKLSVKNPTTDNINISCDTGIR